MLENVPQLCKARGITQKEVALKAGIGEDSLRKWKNHSPSIDKVVAVADILNVSLDELVGRELPGQPTPSERRVLEIFRQLNADGQTSALVMLQGLVAHPGYIKSDLAEEAI